LLLRIAVVATKGNGGFAIRSVEELLPASQSVETNIDATGIPQ
jgi:hypothetical protein